MPEQKTKKKVRRIEATTWKIIPFIKSVEVVKTKRIQTLVNAIDEDQFAEKRLTVSSSQTSAKGRRSTRQSKADLLKELYLPKRLIAEGAALIEEENVNLDKFDEIAQNDIQFKPTQTGAAGIKENEKTLLAEFNKLEDDRKGLAFALVAALVIPKFPAKAPELYADRPSRRENAIEFIRRVYPDLSKEGLPRAEIKRLDPKLYEALGNWLRQHELPADVHLPKRADHYDDLALKISSLAGDAGEISAALHSIARGLKMRAPS